jgi:hypothetical protein
MFSLECRFQEDGTYAYIGRIQAHASTIVGIDFGFREGIEIMISAAKDRLVNIAQILQLPILMRFYYYYVVNRFCVEYDLENSTIESGVVCRPRLGDESQSAVDQDCDGLLTKIEATARPCAILWHPKIGTDSDVEERFIIANDEYKLKEFNIDSKLCRMTTLAPTFGGPPVRLLPVARSGRVSHYAYSCESKVVGLGAFPLRGDPTKVRICRRYFQPGRNKLSSINVHFILGRSWA